MRDLTNSQFPQRVSIIEVGARDGLQNETAVLCVADRVALIEGLSQTGLKRIEAGSFVSPKWVPQMADTGAVLAQLTRTQSVRYSVLTPNMRGFEDSLSYAPDEVSVFTAASDAFTQRNINCSVAESVARFAPIIAEAKARNILVRGYVSTVVACPYAGKIAPDAVLELTHTLLDMGCDEVSLGDTIGVATPRDIARLLDVLLPAVPVNKLAVHFHNTYGQALANILMALAYGIDKIDTAIAGLGGCPYAKGASGNVATEDVVYMLNGMGIDHGVDLAKCISVGRMICARLNKTPPSLVNQASQL